MMRGEGAVGYVAYVGRRSVRALWRLAVHRGRQAGRLDRDAYSAKSRRREKSMIMILALDIATRTGWALLDQHGVLSSGIEDFTPARGESHGSRFLRFRRWLRSVAQFGAPDPTLQPRGPLARVGVLAYERAHHRGGAATQLLVGFQAVVLEEAELWSAETLAVPTGTLKKFATGSGSAGKDAMVKAARDRWPEQNVEGDDQADALFVLAWARKEIGR